MPKIRLNHTAGVLEPGEYEADSNQSLAIQNANAAHELLSGLLGKAIRPASGQSSRRERRDGIEGAALALYLLERREAPTRTAAAKKAHTTKESMAAYENHPEVGKLLQSLRDNPEEAARLRQRRANRPEAG